MSAPTPNTPPALARLQIAPQKKSRRKAGPFALLLLIGGVVVAMVAAYVFTLKQGTGWFAVKKTEPDPAAAAAVPAPAPPPKPGDVVLTVSGYVVPHQRIEISPKLLGTVAWIGVQKGDPVKKDQVIVRLEDEEYRARVLEAQGRVALAEANRRNAEINLNRQQGLVRSNIESQNILDDAVRGRDAAAAEITVAQGQLALAQTYLDWCTIHSPIDGTVLEKLVEPHELVMPQSFGNTRGPRTALVALADLNDLQVEIDLNEADTPKVHLHQHCRVSPEAYPEQVYNGYVAEIAPEANRQKGTLQIKVQVEKPDRFLTPELSAKVDFIKE